MKPKLKPCPFCGTKPKVRKQGITWEVHCIQNSLDCGVVIFAFGETEKQAIENWNRRKESEVGR